MLTILRISTVWPRYYYGNKWLWPWHWDHGLGLGLGGRGLSLDTRGLANITG